jgi:L-seryl-tRNA(Ser) seleniumtransferase
MQPVLDKNLSALYRAIPSVEEMLCRFRDEPISRLAGRSLVIDAIRSVLADMRFHLASGSRLPVVSEIESQILAVIERELANSLSHVINATGVVLHTNLGRAPLSQAAAKHIAMTTTHYSNLEYDLPSGSRGKRDVHAAKHLTRLTGAEAAIVVNNNAAALFLALNTLAKCGEVIVSRGELVEIGDGFRIPDIMAESGAVLREVGTTNRTRIADYERAITDSTRLLLRIHPSNFRIVGFAERPSIKELVSLGQRFRLPVVEDLGSGCLANLTEAGISEPTAGASLGAGASVVTFSGDKLLGGPQAGIIAGKKEYVDRIRRNPLFRAVRVDKLTLAALEATFSAYRRGALDEIPALHMIRMRADEIERRARALVERLRHELTSDATLEIRPGTSVIGGGSTPDQSLPTYLISVASQRCTASTLEERLRCPAFGVPVIARIEEDCVALDLRTVFSEEEQSLAGTLRQACQQPESNG